MTPRRLRVEHLDSPLGLQVEHPRFAWWLPTGALVQEAYQLQVDDWDSGQVVSSACFGVPYGGPQLPSSELVPWRVRVWTDLGESDWAEGSFGTALRVADWVAQWVSPVEDEPKPEPGKRPGYLLRGRLVVPRSVAHGQLHLTAHGIYEAHLNGARVGDEELTPGFTAYGSNLQVQAYDVTDLLREGDNELVVTLADGWFRGLNAHERIGDSFGDDLALLAQLVVRHQDGTTSTAGTGSGWESGRGPVLAADLIAGQRVDLGVAPHDWQPARVVERPFDALRGRTAPPVRRVEELAPVSVARLSGGQQVVDLGQNINGWVRLAGVRGTVTVEHGEALDADGRVTRDHLKPHGQLDAGQVDTVTGQGSFEPRLSTKGFQYVQTSAAVDVTGVAVHTDLERTGHFACSDAELNRLHEVAVWSLRGNVCDIPTDCPTRERSGWTGDWQLYVPTAAFLYDVAGFNAKWLRDLAAQQWPDGRVPNYVPDPSTGRGQEPHEITRWLTGSAGWGDAAVQVPYYQWWCYGDVRLIEEQWDSMVAWVDYAARSAREERHESKEGTPAEPHEQYIWDGGFHWGEWLEPGDDSEAIRAVFERRVDQGVVATAYLYRSAAQLAELAGVLGRDSSRWTELADKVRDAWQREYIRDGRLVPETQATYARALAFGLLPRELVRPAADRLAELVRQGGTHVGTGFLATPLLLPALAENGHLDVAYDLLLQRSEPSWLCMLDRGATTVWEAWNGLDAKGRAFLSLNHYSKGAVISFLHQHVAGLRQVAGEPAYRRFVVAPQPGGGLTWAEASLASPYGPIGSAWRQDEARLLVEVKVPPGTSALLQLPNGSTRELAAGEHRISA